MKKLFTATLALSLYALPAMANEPAPGDCSAMEGDAKTQCEEAKAATDKAMAEAKAALEALGDCSDKADEAKAECETQKAELEAKVGGGEKKEEADAAKGGKAKRSDTNRMEVVNEDE
jgi:hypothetical protein